MLNTIVHGTPTAHPPLVIAHGLFGSARNWGAIGKRLGARRQVIAVDMRNHGDSPHHPDHGYDALAADLAALIAGHGGQADVLGHSMGGKAAMVLALTDPGRVARLVIADIAPVRYDHSQIGHVETMQALDLGRVTRRSDADRALADALTDPMLRAFLLQSLVFGAQGARWKLNLDALGAQMHRIMDFPDMNAVFDGPALFVTGANSDYVRPEHEKRIRALFPAAQHVEIPDAGHWIHAEAPRAFAAAIEAFLDAGRETLDAPARS